MRSRAAVIFLLLLFVIAAGPAWADKRIALVIGNAAYQNVPRLANPVNDASVIAEMFRAAKFDVVESKNDLTNLDMKFVLRKFRENTRDADIAVVYFAGHGIEVNGKNYLVPVDAKLSHDRDVEDEAITVDRLLDVIGPAEKLRLVILDACRDNPFARTMMRRVESRTKGRGLIGWEPGDTGTLIALAAKAHSVADDDAGNDSPYTKALLKHLARPGLDLRLAFGRIQDDVMKATGDRQQPWVYGSLGGGNISLVPVKAQQSGFLNRALLELERAAEAARDAAEKQRQGK